MVRRRTFSRIAWVTLTALILTAGSVFCQDQRVNLQRIDLTGLPEVRLYFTVTDAAGRSVLGLTGREIEVTLDGNPQAISSLQSALQGGESLAVVLLFDRSGSMKSALDNAKAAAVGFTRRLSTEDRVAVISFDDSVNVDSELSKDRAAVEQAISGISLGRDTALHDAIRKGLELVENSGTNRQAIVILSDGKDTKSRLQRSDVLQQTKDRGVPLFTINLGETSDTANLEDLSAQTGGFFFKAAEPQDLLALYQAIADQLSNQYLLTFQLSSVDEQFHGLKIDFKDPEGQIFSAQRDFVATKGPGIKRETVSYFQGQVEKKNLLFRGAVGALFGMILSLLILVLLKAGRPDLNLISPLTIGLIFSALLLGAVLSLVSSFF